MNFPTWVYKDGVFNTPGPRLVHNAKECLLALEDGWWSHRYKKEDIPGLFKAEIKEAEIKEDNDAVLTRFTEVKKPNLDEINRYHDETGQEALHIKGPHKGKPTKDFKQWRKNASK